MTTLETLKSARRLITPKRRWIQEDYARAVPNNTGSHVDPNSPLATCWCSIGAIGCIQERSSASWNFEFEEAFGMEEGALETFNDTHTHAEVLAAFDAAIAKLTTQRGD